MVTTFCISTFITLLLVQKIVAQESYLAAQTREIMEENTIDVSSLINVARYYFQVTFFFELSSWSSIVLFTETKFR